jgi:hypothetical protein
VSEDEPTRGPDGNAWFSPGPCPDCLQRIKKEVWLIRVTVGNPSHTIAHECRTCGYNLPMTYEGFKIL